MLSPSFFYLFIFSSLEANRGLARGMKTLVMSTRREIEEKELHC